MCPIGEWNVQVFHVENNSRKEFYAIHTVHKRTSELHKVQFTININLIRVSAPDCHTQRILQIKGTTLIYVCIAITAMIKVLRF
jgi:hypothetical protein